MGFVLLRFSALTCSGIARLSLTNSRGGTCHPSLRDFAEWVRGRPYASPRRARASLMYVTRAPSCAHVYARMCVRERVCPVCQESIRGVRAVYRAGESRGGRIDIKIVTEFRRAATYPNALSSPLNYPFSSRVHFTLLPFPFAPRNRVPVLCPFPDSSETCACSALQVRKNFSKRKTSS